MEFVFETVIAGNHLDVFGHVNNANYLELYEEARWDFIEKNGFGLERIKRDKVGPVILDINITFKAELLNRDKVKIISHPGEMKNKLIMALHQKIVKEDGTVASFLMMHIGFFDLEKRKLIPPTKDWFKAIGIA
ncbi:MAG: acyl-CoA thioesterase [Epsilonproteobacteria bacterium]|nr:MAG: acyl-CoA thioesterase [Campylobacterota bacterium]